MNPQQNIKIELTDKIAEQYIRLSKTKSELIIIEKLCDLMNSLKEPEDKQELENFFWTRFCIWESIFINYHKLFSEPMKAENGQKVNKYQMHADDFFKTSPKHLLAFHEKILSIRHHLFVHGGTEIYEKSKLFADITIDVDSTLIQLYVEVNKNGDIENTDVEIVRELILFLYTQIEQKLQKCNEKITDALHQKIENNNYTITT